MKFYQFLTLIMLIPKCIGILNMPWFVVFIPCMIQPLIWLCEEAIKYSKQKEK